MEVKWMTGNISVTIQNYFRWLNCQILRTDWSISNIRYQSDLVENLTRKYYSIYDFQIVIDKNNACAFEPFSSCRRIKFSVCLV